MSSLSRSVVVVLLTVLVGAVSGARAAEVDAKSAEVLTAMSAYLKSLDRMGAVLTLHSERTIDGQTQKDGHAIRVVIDRPDRLAMTPVGESARLGSIYVAEGKMTAVAPALGKYTVTDAPKSLDEAVQSREAVVLSGGLLGGIGPVLTGDAKAAIEVDVERIEYIGAEKLGVVEAHRLRAHRDGGSMDWWIAAGDKPMLLRVQPDLSPIERQAKAEGQDVKLAAWLEVSSFEADPELGDKEFAYAPAEGVAKADSLFDAAAGGGPEGGERLVGQPAPAFTLTNLDDERVELASHKDKQVVVLDFWATWCPPCRKGLPDIAAVAAEYADKGVVVYAVNCREDKATIAGYLENAKLDLTALLDQDGRVANQYGVTGIPQTVIIGKDGVIKHVHVGLTPKAKLTAELDALLK